MNDTYRCPQCGARVTDDEDPRHTCPNTVGLKPHPLCPECTQGKVFNCAGQALLGDDLVPCANTLEQGL